MSAGENQELLNFDDTSSTYNSNWTIYDMTEICSFHGWNGTESIRKLLADPNCFSHSPRWTLFLCISYTLILICGLVGNSLVIFVVAWKPRMRTVTNMFILNLALADLFVIVFCVPATLLANIFIPWVLGDFLCRAVAYVQGVSIFASVYSLAAVSFDRCRAIYRPMDLSNGLSRAQALVLMLLIWLTGILITLPWLFVFEIVTSPESGPVPYCHENWPVKLHGQIYFSLVHLLVNYFMPLTLIITFNYIIWKSVSSRQLPNYPSASRPSHTAMAIQQLHRATKLRVLKMLASLTLAFFLCWLPLYTIMGRIKFFGVPAPNPDGTDSWQLELMHVSIPISQLLGSCNSCVNPILYALLNKKFRQSLRSILASCCGRCWLSRRYKIYRVTTGNTPTVRCNNAVVLNSPVAARASRSRHSSSNTGTPSNSVVIPLRISTLTPASRQTSNLSITTQQILLPGISNSNGEIQCTSC